MIFFIFLYVVLKMCGDFYAEWLEYRDRKKQLKAFYNYGVYKNGKVDLKAYNRMIMSNPTYDLETYCRIGEKYKKLDIDGYLKTHPIHNMDDYRKFKDYIEY